MILTILFGREIPGMLATSPRALPRRHRDGRVRRQPRAIVHFTLMRSWSQPSCWPQPTPVNNRNPILAGFIYCLITYVVMNWLVVPLRFDTPLPPKSLSIAAAVRAHRARRDPLPFTARYQNSVANASQ
jgi:hypothetical protein